MQEVPPQFMRGPCRAGPFPSPAAGHAGARSVLKRGFFQLDEKYSPVFVEILLTVWPYAPPLNLAAYPRSNPLCARISARFGNSGLFAAISHANLEVTEKHPGSVLQTRRLVWGLGHVGIQVGELSQSLRFYEALGFRRDFAPVENETSDGPVECCMVTRDGLTLELYAFTRCADAPMQKHPAFAELVIPGLQAPLQGPAGECLTG